MAWSSEWPPIMRTPLGASAMRARSMACILQQKMCLLERLIVWGSRVVSVGLQLQQTLLASIWWPSFVGGSSPARSLFRTFDNSIYRAGNSSSVKSAIMIDVVATIGDVTIRETVQRLSLTVADLHALVVADLAQRAPHLSIHTVQLTVEGTILAVDCTPLTAIQSDVVQCTVRCAPQLLRCAPLWGAGGCTVVTVHGVGFEAVDGSARLRFGTVDVPCQRTSSTTIRCIAPDHPPGIVNVRLVRCEEDDSDEDEASFEFVRLETNFDVIFATTNSHCPVRGAARGDEERVRGWTPND